MELILGKETVLRIQYGMLFPFMLKFKISEMMRFPKENRYHDLGRLLEIQYWQFSI